MSKVYVELVDNQIAAYSDYSPDFVTKFKSIGGAKWHPKDKSWRYTPSMDVCRALRGEFGKKLIIGDDLNKWAKRAKDMESQLAELTTAEDAELSAIPTLSPALSQAMSNRRYQRVAAKFIAIGKNVLIADEPGLGKTLEAIGGLMEADCWRGPVLIVAPLTSLRSVWERELRKWTPDAVVTVAVPTDHDSAVHRAKIIDGWLDDYAATDGVRPHILIVNPEMVRDAHKKFGLLLEVRWNAVIVDESHRYLAGIRSAKNKTQTGEGLMNLELRSGGLKIALSGTPMRGKPSNLWGTLHWLEPKTYSSYYNWARTFFFIGSDRYSQFIVGDLRKDREELLYRSLDRIMLRRTKSEVVKELPPKQHIEIVCDMPPAQKKQYEQMAQKAMAELDDVDLKAIGVLAIMTRLKQMANCSWGMDPKSFKPKANMTPETSGKTAVIHQMLVERGIAGDERQGTDKIVIASQFTQVINSLGDFLEGINVPFHVISGEVKETERTAVTESFQTEGGPRVLLMNTKAGGVSITLDAYCDELIIVDETWNPDDQVQLEDRIHRVSRIHQVMIYQLITADSIDEYIKKVTTEKRSVTSLLLDERRGVSFAHTLIEGKVA